jgi:siroheme synthase (precorrin-2 oxidase/ferrochelatase)
VLHRRLPSACTSIDPRHYPANLILEGRTCVVFGAGPQADERARQLALCGAVLRRAAATPLDEAIGGAFLVVVELDVEEADARVIAGAARAAGALVYAVDRTALSDLALPALVRRGLLTVAVSTSGAGPLLARHLRDELAAVLPEALAAFTDRLAALRESLRDLPREERTARLQEALAGLRIEGHVELPDE